MTSISLGGTLLPMSSLTEDTKFVGSNKPQWKNGVCSPFVKVYGTYQVYTITCVENNVAWASSVAVALENSMGSVLTFIQTTDQRIPVGTVNVKVTRVQSRVFNMTSLQRDITLTAVTT
jgi:hypothetical protein